MKLTPRQLKVMYDFAREEMRDRAASKHEDLDIHVAKCWVAALQRALAKDKLYLSAFDINEAYHKIEDV